MYIISEDKKETPYIHRYLERSSLPSLVPQVHQNGTQNDGNHGQQSKRGEQVPWPQLGVNLLNGLGKSRTRRFLLHGCQDSRSRLGVHREQTCKAGTSETRGGAVFYVSKVSRRLYVIAWFWGDIGLVRRGTYQNLRATIVDC